jgi:hypothetical protein
MKWMTIGTPPFDSIETLDRIRGELDATQYGLEASYAGTAEDGTLRVVTVWESKEHADRFFTEVLGPTLARVLAPEPVGAQQVVGVQVERISTANPVA